MLNSRMGRASSVLLLTGLSFGLGAGGIDFGRHWDEPYYVDGVVRGLESAVMLSGEYIYNGLYFDVGFVLIAASAIPCIPDALEEMALEPNDPFDPTDAVRYPRLVECRKRLIDRVRSPEFLLLSRLVYLALTSLSVVALYLLLRRIAPDEPLAALVAAAIPALSFEVGTHARWVAVDTPVMATVAFTLLFVARALTATTDSQRLIDTALAGAFGGLVLSWKLTGVTILFPILALACVPGLSLRARAHSALAALVPFGVAFLFTTPAVVLDPIRFAGSFFYTRSHYFDFSLNIYRTNSSFHTIGMLLAWLGADVVTSYPLLSIVFALLALLGFVHWRRTSPRTLLVLGGYSLMHALLLALPHKFFVRNALQLVPVFAIAVGLGATTLLRLARERFGHRGSLAVYAFLGASALLQLSWDARAMSSIRTTTAASIQDDAVEWLNDRDDRPVYVSPRLYFAIGPRLSYRCGPATSSWEEGRVALHAADYFYQWKANRPLFYQAIFSSGEVDHTHYPTWIGRWFQERIYVVSTGAAARMKLDPAPFLLCRPLR